MPNGVATFTVTAKLGPELATTAAVFNRVTNVNFDFNAQVIEITYEDGKLVQFAYSSVATITWTKAAATAASTTAVTIST